jgi:WD40 repeat protein/class 3 adenylate cyclase
MLTLVFTDLAGSTALKSSLGDQTVAGLIARHRGHIEGLASRQGGRIIDWAGDGCFLTFETSSAAVLFALALQQAHTAEPGLPGVRVGVHIGEVSETGQPGQAAPRVEGLAVDLAARIASLAKPTQVLMSSAVFNSVRQRLRGDDLGAEIVWLAHGAYELKGFDDPLEICEAGINGVSPLAPPPGSEKAHRAVTPTEEDTLGWRPAVGLHVPRREHWVLEQPLGAGGFGEVWLAIHEKTKAKRVFKFCFEPERVRGLKREVVLFRLLKETLGHRDDIAQIVDWEFERAPYFLESEYTEGGDLRDWAARRGGLDRVPLGTRLELVAQTAVALGAAHSVGVLHKDIKPANILISEVAGKDKPRASLTDFGIGLITDPGALAAQGITAAGLTQTLAGSSSSSSDSGAGTRLYMAPEQLEGKAATTLTDIYSLGVVLYQMVTGDLTHAVAPGWERGIDDDLLREDIGLCIDGDPERRLKSADELAKRLRNLSTRRAEREARRELEQQAERARRRRRQFTVATASGVSLTVVVGLFALAQYRRAETETGLRSSAEQARAEAEAARTEADRRRQESEALREEAERGQYVANTRLAANYIAQQNVAGARSLLVAAPPPYRNWEWGHLVNLAWPAAGNEERGLPAPQSGKTAAELWRGAKNRLVVTVTGHSAGILSVAFHPDGKRLASGSSDSTLRVWNLTSGSELWRREFHSGPISSLAVSPDGKLVAAALPKNGEIAAWDFDTGTRMQTFVGHTDQCAAVGFNVDGSRLCTVGLDQTYRIWDVASGNSLGVRKIEGDFSFVADAYFVPNSTQVMTTEPGNRVTVWDYMTGQVIRTVQGPSAETFKSGRIDPDGRAVISWSASLGSLTVWETETGGEIYSYLVGRALGPLPAIRSPDGSVNVVRREDGISIGIGLETPNIIPCGPLAMGKPAAFSADGAMLAIPEQDGSIRIFAPSQEAARSEEAVKHHADVVYLAAFTSDGGKLITASFDGTLQITDTRSLQTVKEIAAHKSEVSGMSISPDDRYLVTFGFDGIWRVWDLLSGEQAFEVAAHLPANFAGGARGPATRISASLLEKQYFSGDGRRVALTTAPGEVSVFEVPSGRVICVAKNQRSWSYRNTFSADGHFLLCTPYQELYVTLFNADSGTVVAELKGHAGQLLHTNFSPDGTRIVTTSVDKTARLWDGRTGAFLRSLEGHTATTFFAGFSPDSRIVVTTAVDNTARLWRADTGEALATMSGHPGAVMGASFSPDGARVLTTSQDNVTRVWNTQGQLLAELRLGAGEDLYYATWSPDGRTIVTTTSKGTARLWRAADWTAFRDPVTSEEDFETQVMRAR